MSVKMVRRKSGYYTLGPDLRAGSISSQYGALMVPAGGPFSGKDVMADPGFDVPFSSTVNVSGGGAALATAVAAAGPGTRIVILDSLVYDTQVVIAGKTDLTIEAAAGQTPTISLPPPGVFPGTVSSEEILITGVCDGLKFKRLRFLDRGNRNSLSFADNGCIVSRETCTGLTRVIVEDCSFEEAADSPLNGKNGILLASGGSGGPTFDKIVVRRCTFDTMGAGANNTAENLGAVTICGFGDVWIQNCWIRRTDALVARAASHQRGTVTRNVNTIIENVLSDDIGTAGSNESFKTISSTGPQYGSAVGPTLCRNCVAFESKRGFRAEQPSGSTMTVSRSAYDTPTAGITDRAFRLTAGSALVVEDTVAVGGGTGTAFESASIVENNNDIFNFAALGKVLDPTDQTIDPLFFDVPNRLWVATAPSLVTGGSDGGRIGVRYSTGEQVIWAGP